MSETMAANTELWNSVCETDPAYTKNFTRGGGFRGTAINALYLIRKATELWGPLGQKWGVQVLSDTYQPAAPIVREGVIVGHEIVHVVRIELRYPEGIVQAYGQTTFVGVNKHGAFTDEEAPKKSLTDALTKALSWLGFSADVHMGLFDDNKYVASLKEKYASEPSESTDGEEDTAVTLAKSIIRNCDSIEKLQTAWKSLTPKLRENEAVAEAKDKQKADLMAVTT